MSKHNTKVEYTQVVREITSLLQKAESLEDALRTSLGEVVKADGAEAGLKHLNLTNVSGN